MISIGDIFNTESIGWCKVVDIYVSTTTQERVYKVNTFKDDSPNDYFLTGAELQ